jgi:hypothetical protein
MSNLTLNVKKKWFDMILSGEKIEEYREIKLLYCNKFSAVCEYRENNKGILPDKANTYFNSFYPVKFKHFDTLRFLNGMKKQTPTIVVECKGISIGKAVPEWSDNWQGEVFVIKLGKIISTKNIK